MRRANRTWIGLIAGAGFLATVVALPIETVAQKKPTPPQAPTATFEKDVAPIVTKYCASCHSGSQAAGGIQLTAGMTSAAVQKNPNAWARVAARVGNGSMPPKGLPAPTDAQRRQMVAWIDKNLAGDCKLADPGKVTLRRLNREEYNNTVRDLMGVSIRPADDFPSDDVGYGFDNIGDVLSMSPLLMEKYLTASEKVVRAAIRIPKARSQSVEGASLQHTQGATPREGVMFFGSTGTASQRFKVTAPGWYRIRLRLGEMHAGDQYSLIDLRLDRDKLTTFEVREPISAPGNYDFPTKLASGEYNIGATFTNDYYVAPANGRPAADRNAILYSMELIGPIEDGQVQTAFQRRLIPSVPPKEGWDLAAKTALTGFASKAYRRPVTSEEIDRLVTVFKYGARSADNYETGMQLACQAVLCNPNFLFRVELDGASANTRVLNPYEIASRLSYFLWSSMPDDTLFAYAKSGELVKPEILAEQVQRMIQDPKSDALVENFATQWLQLRKLNNFEPDVKQFPAFNPELKESMLTETKMYFTDVMRENKPISEFLDSKYTYVNEPLAKLYGMTGVTGRDFRKVSTEGTGRGGVITQASVLAITSNPTRTSPTKRGRWILEQILGTPPPPPPPGVPDLAEKHITEKMSVRQKLEEHRKNPTCAACHREMDALGFGFENFDPIGKFRSADGAAPIDASADLPGGRKFTGATQLKTILMADKQLFARSFIEKLMTYAIGRGVDVQDRCFVDDVVKSTSAGNYKFGDIVAKIVNSDPFKKRKVEGVGK
jgi:mono/diheme cytochrome c family protein